ncbi:MAG: PKD domain-containing protein [Candidatus Hermodarchaeota archaeon]
MRNSSKALVLIFLLISILNPILHLRGVRVEADEEQSLDPFSIEPALPIFVVGACGPRDIAHWDPCTYVASTGDYYLDNTLECLFTFPYNTTGELDDLQPVLATSWIYEYRPDEMNVAGFMNYDGIKSVEITLRQGVKFHDGSDWNATVCKWNIDRLMTIIGNISGVTDVLDANLHSRRDTFWLEQGDWAAYETPGWNVTQFAGKPGEYPGFGTSTEATMVGRWPRFYNVTIIEDLQSGGKIKIHFGDWGTGMAYLRGIVMISMYSYADYFDTAILGYGDNPSFPQDNPAVFPGHLIGTGPYVFEAHIADIGTLHRFNDWWNATAQQADGWHMIGNVALATFAHTEAGFNARSTAMITGDVHFAYDRAWEPLNYDDMIAAPNVNYIPLGVEGYGENIILNCINETFMWTYANVLHLNMSGIYGAVPYWPGPQFMASGVLNPDWTLNAHGINRAFRKAISYAFDYDTYIHVAFNDRVVRSGGLLGKANPYYNSSIPIAYRNLTIARQALLDDPFWGPICAARGLSNANDTADWNFVADTNPIYEMEYNYDQAHLEAYSVMQTSLRDIGCVIDASEDVPDTYTKMTTFFTFPWTITDGFAMKFYYPRYDVLSYIQPFYKSPAAGSIWPYDQFYNMGFNYNDTCDDLIERIWFQNSTGVQDSYNKLADWAQNFQYPYIYLGNDLVGYAINNDYEYTWYWETFKFNFVKGGGPNLLPVADFSVNSTDIIEGETVSFTFTGDEGDPSATYLWDFGDGYYSANQNPTHQYTTAGTYTVSLNIIDANGDSDNETKIDLITVNPDLFPYSNFTADRTTIPVNGRVEFDFTGTLGNSPATFFWDFGDGYFSAIQNPTHQYTTVGTYTVSLTVTDLNGDEDTETKADFITVEEAPPDGEIFGYETNLIIGIISITIVVIILKKPKFKTKNKIKGS